MSHTQPSQPGQPRIGLVLGSGSARGWAHIGVIKELQALGVTPDVVCGTSVGALVGAFFVTGHLGILEEWIRQLDRRRIIHYLDIKFPANGGFTEGARLTEFFRAHIGDTPIESLDIPYAAVATDLGSGQEVWLREGSILNAVRASLALPGLFTPAQFDSRWLVDGGLVNPVPVSLARALGADLVIAVNLNCDLAGRHLRKGEYKAGPVLSADATLIDKLSHQIRQRTNNVIAQLFENGSGTPGLLDIMAGAINVMQDRITRTRLAETPPDLLIEPRLAHLGLLDFDHASEAIAIGAETVRASAIKLNALLEKHPGVLREDAG